jgi:hypothetical protein
MAQVRHVYAWWVGLLVVVVGLALGPPMVAGAADCDVFPGDGVDGPPLVYKDNGNGTLTDQNTGLIWEKKNTTAGSVHNVINAYMWDGTLFTDFLFKLNNRCALDETTACTRNADCAAVGGQCGFAGHRDWRIPNVRELQSIVDYGAFNPAIDPDFGPTAAGNYWSSPSFAANPSNAWDVFFSDGFVFAFGKDDTFRARAVRGGR